MEQLLRLYLRLTGVFLLLALPIAFFPHTWMNAIHIALGMGPLAQTPLVSYLTRSICVLYASFGAGCCYVAREPRRFRALLRFVARVSAWFTLAILGINAGSGMPEWWTVTEVVALSTWTLGLWWLVRGNVEAAS